jgi:Cof subfamily protein (haloacid dehalogenase superfamily)
MTKVKLILTDLDETLLHTDKTISEYSTDTLKRCQHKGILVGFCTSRGITSIGRYIKQIAPDVVICNGGACIYYQGELIHTAAFSIEETRTMLKKVYEVCGKDCEITVDTLDKLYWNRDKNKSEQFSNNAIYDDFLDFTKPAMKFCVQTSDAQKAKLIANAVPSCDYLPFSDVPWYKFSSGTATKEHSIKVLSEKLNISLNEIISFGDDFNDMGMLKLCGKGIAMQNAIPQVKEIADEITLSNNEDGVARYLEKLLNC